MIVSIDFARQLFEQPGKVSSLLLRLKDGVSVEKAKEQLQQLLGDRYVVKDRYEQHGETFRIMQIERPWLSCFSRSSCWCCFNIIGSVAMLIIDKREDIETCATSAPPTA